MRRIATAICVALLQLLYITAHGQQRSALSVGDTLSGLLTGNVMGGAEDKTIFDANERKAVIFDFGTTGCAPCLTSILYLDSLQKQFDDALNIFFVTRERKQHVARFIKHNAVGVKVRETIPIIYEDTLLHDILFPHIFQPHQVWIDRNGVIRAITDHHAANTTTLKQLVNGKDMALPQKLDHLYDMNSPIIQLNESFVNKEDSVGMVDDFVIAIVGEQNGYVPKRYRQLDSITRRIRETYINYPLLKLYLSLLGRKWKTSFYPAQIEMHNAPNTLHAKNITLEAYYGQALSDRQVELRIKSYLDAYFGVEARLLREPRTVWVLRPTRSGMDRVKGAFSTYNFVYRMNQRLSSVYVHDATGGDLSVDFDDQCLLMGIEELNDYLHRYGVGVYEEEMEIEVLHIKEAAS